MAFLVGGFLSSQVPIKYKQFSRMSSVILCWVLLLKIRGPPPPNLEIIQGSRKISLTHQLTLKRSPTTPKRNMKPESIRQNVCIQSHNLICFMCSFLPYTSNFSRVPSSQHGSQVTFPTRFFARNNHSSFPYTLAVILSHLSFTPLKTYGCPLKINGWKMYSLLK